MIFNELQAVWFGKHANYNTPLFVGFKKAISVNKWHESLSASLLGHEMPVFSLWCTGQKYCVAEYNKICHNICELHSTSMTKFPGSVSLLFAFHDWRYTYNCKYKLTNALQQGIPSNSSHTLVQSLQCFITDLSNRLCVGSWLSSAHSSGSANIAKTSKSGTNITTCLVFANTVHYNSLQCDSVVK